MAGQLLTLSLDIHCRRRSRRSGVVPSGSRLESILRTGFGTLWDILGILVYRWRPTPGRLWDTWDTKRTPQKSYTRVRARTNFIYFSICPEKGKDKKIWIVRCTDTLGYLKEIFFNILNYLDIFLDASGRFGSARSLLGLVGFSDGATRPEGRLPCTR